MVGIELVRSSENRAPYPTGDRVGHKVILEARKRGAILRPLEDTIVVMPPLSISPDDLERLVDIVYASIKKATEES